MNTKSMTSDELKEIIAGGETSTVQFKQQLDSMDGIAAEIIAMSNAKGGNIVFGVEDKTGKVVGLDYAQLQDIGNRLATIASDMVKPQVFITTEVVSMTVGDEVRRVLVATISEGTAKPYKDKSGVIWVKQGSDKRRLTDNSEQIRLFQQSGLLFVDEMIVPETSMADIDKDKVQEYLQKINEDDVDLDFDKEQIYRNIGIIKDNRLTLAGLLFFGKHPQRYRPAFCIKAVAFYGNDIAETHYRDSLDITGTIPKMFEEGMRFFNMNLFHTQQGQDFNSVGKLEISEIALQELLQNALTHRDYSKNAPVRLFVFDNRIEIISPGCLPNSLTIENILMGNAVVRNNLIVSYASKLMKYRGLGSGVARAARNQPDLELYNDREGEQFRVVIPRKKT
jgi:predicted HTH transcriptional regulator